MRKITKNLEKKLKQKLKRKNKIQYIKSRWAAYNPSALYFTKGVFHVSKI